MTGSIRKKIMGALVAAGGALALAVPLLAVPTPAHAWWRGGGWGWHGGWHGGCCWGGWRGGVVIGIAPPPVYYAPPPVYYAPPRAYYPPPRHWVPPFWNGSYWVPGHWA